LTTFDVFAKLDASTKINLPEEVTVSRVQLALNVSDIDEAIGFYSKLFGVSPAKVRPGYANFAVAEPPLKLVLIEGHGDPGTLNHLGVEVESADDVAAANVRLSGEGLPTATEDEVSCCFAVQDKVWVDGPSGEAWEIYTVLADAEEQTSELCCAGAPASEERCC
jgi:catechol 2,3-dioxygenase-like lactoylglutathione lyase family enzyme